MGKRRDGRITIGVADQRVKFGDGLVVEPVYVFMSDDGNLVSLARSGILALMLAGL